MLLSQTPDSRKPDSLWRYGSSGRRSHSHRDGNTYRSNVIASAIQRTTQY